MKNNDDGLYPAHPLADLFPMIPEPERIMLADDIAKHGQHEPILLFEGMVLDGRNRQWACGHLGIQAMYVQYTGDDALSFVFSKNLHRRHLTESQRALVAARLATWKFGENQHSSTCANLPVWKAAKKLSISARSVGTAKYIINKAIPEVIIAVTEGRLSINKARDIARLAPLGQRQALRSGKVNKHPESQFGGLTKLLCGRKLNELCWGELLDLALSYQKQAQLLRAVHGYVANADDGQQVQDVLNARQIADILSVVEGEWGK